MYVANTETEMFNTAIGAIRTDVFISGVRYTKDKTPSYARGKAHVERTKRQKEALYCSSHMTDVSKLDKARLRGTVNDYTVESLDKSVPPPSTVYRSSTLQVCINSLHLYQIRIKEVALLIE